MKRVVLACVILAVIVTVSVLSMWDMQRSLDDILGQTAALRQSAQSLSSGELAARCEALIAAWDKMERRFMLYVRHGSLDSIMEHLSELPAFCEAGEYAELLSTLDAAAKLMEHLQESVTPSYRTLL